MIYNCQKLFKIGMLIMKLKKMTEKVKQIFTKPLKFFKGSSSENDVFEKWSEASGKEKIKIIGQIYQTEKILCYSFCI